MALAKLPNELLETIITHVIPEGFESLAVTCKRIHALCIPFFQHYNALNLRFRHFAFYEDQYDSSRTIGTAGDLIRRIAVEPVVARYIRSADLKLDSPRSHIISHHFIQESDCREDILRCFANCPYLKRAGLDWKDYVHKIEGEFNQNKRPHYSQYAAAFLLTLLPNVEKLILPQYWRQLDDTDKLIDAICQIAKHPSSHILCNRSSLARVTRFEPYVSLVPQDCFDLDLTKPFLALPQVRSFRGPSCVVFNEQVEYKNTVSKKLSYVFGKTLESISFEACCIDEKAIADFLKDASHLKTFRYSHSTKKGISPQRWDICNFIAAIERRVGSQLVELSISIREPFDSIAAGNVSMRKGFPCLRQLEIPLEVVMCNITANKSTVGGSSDVALSIGDLIPASVSILSLISSGKDHFDKALKVLFLDFAVKKESVLPALKEIHLVCPNGADIIYKNHCEELLLEAHRAGVVLYLQPWPHSGALIWNGEG